MSLPSAPASTAPDNDAAWARTSEAFTTTNAGFASRPRGYWTGRSSLGSGAGALVQATMAADRRDQAQLSPPGNQVPPRYLASASARRDVLGDAPRRVANCRSVECCRDSAAF
jgi:hypothetical protein